MISSISSQYSAYAGRNYKLSAATTSAASKGGQVGGANSDSATISSTSISASGMSISQIRDITDQMAIDGKLTIKQQMALIGGGLMDPNPENPSYQPTTSGIRVGYSRSDTGSYDFVGMVQSYATEAASLGNSELAGIFSGIARSFQDYASSHGYTTDSHVDVQV